MNQITKLVFLSRLFNPITDCPRINPKPQKVMQIENEELQIVEITRQLTDLMIAGNTKEINTIVDEDFTLTHITGYVQSKAEWFSEIETGQMNYYGYQEVSTMVKIENKKAIFIGQNLLDARIWGKRNNWRLQQKMELEKRNGKWVIVQSIAITF